MIKIKVHVYSFTFYTLHVKERNEGHTKLTYVTYILVLGR